MSNTNPGVLAALVAGILLLACSTPANTGSGSIAIGPTPNSEATEAGPGRTPQLVAQTPARGPSPTAPATVAPPTPTLATGRNSAAQTPLATPAATLAAATAARRTPTLDCTPHSFAQRTQQSLAVDPNDDRILYVGVEQSGYFKSVDGGESWTRATNGIKAWERSDGAGQCYEEFYSTIIDPRNSDSLCLAMAGGPGTTGLATSAGNNGVYCSDDGAGTWRQRVTPSMNTAVYTLAADPGEFRTMYAGVNGGACSNPPPVCAENTFFNIAGAIYKTEDGGESWRELDTLRARDVRVVSVHVAQTDPSLVFAGTFSKISGLDQSPGNFHDAEQLGLLKSTDAGETWSSSTDGMSNNPNEQALLGMRVSPANPDRLFVTASSNVSYWSSDGGETFNLARRVPAFEFDPHGATGLHLLGSSGLEVLESVDGGANWSEIARLPEFRESDRATVTAVRWSQQDPRTVYMAGPYASVFKSIDGGASWTQVLSADRLPGLGR